MMIRRILLQREKALVGLWDVESRHWNKLGQDLDGEATFGTSVALSADGSILAAGATQLWNGGSGYARLLDYDRDANLWN